MLFRNAVTLICLCLFTNVYATNIVQEAPLVSLPEQDSFFNKIAAHCGKAYRGTIITDTPGDDGFGAGQTLLMHVRKCSERELQIPFHIGDDASRTWIITKTGSGLMLKHDHRNKDGSYHTSTMYGGHTNSKGYAQWQAFPADEYSKNLFIKSKIPQSMDNVWQIFIYEESFSYRLIRPAREFRVDFDLTRPVKAPSAPWGYSD